MADFGPYRWATCVKMTQQLLHFGTMMLGLLHALMAVISVRLPHLDRRVLCSLSIACLTCGLIFGWSCRAEYLQAADGDGSPLNPPTDVNLARHLRDAPDGILSRLRLFAGGSRLSLTTRTRTQPHCEDLSPTIECGEPIDRTFKADVVKTPLHRPIQNSH